MFELPEGIAAKVDKNILDPHRHRSKSCSATRRRRSAAIRPPEPYKGKGIKYVEETIKRKVGKTGRRKELMSWHEDSARRSASGASARSIRKKVTGTAERPRLSVFRSAKHIYAQAERRRAPDDVPRASTLDEAAQAVADGPARRASKAQEDRQGDRASGSRRKGIDKVVFDRNGYIYHGRVKEIADAAREAGLKF